MIRDGLTLNPAVHMSREAHPSTGALAPREPEGMAHAALPVVGWAGLAIVGGCTCALKSLHCAPMTDNEHDEQIQQRLLELSEWARVVDWFQDIADAVDEWWADGVAEDEIDRRIRAWLKANEFDPHEWIVDDPALARFTEKEKHALIEALQINKWALASIKHIANTGKPLPFYPFMHGDVIVDNTTMGDGEVMIWAFATRFTDPSVVAAKFMAKCREQFGEQAFKNLDKSQEAAEFVRMHRQGMSYKEIAIQSLREQIPEVVRHPELYKKQIKKERWRVIGAIKAQTKLWNERAPFDSIG